VWTSIQKILPQKRRALGLDSAFEIFNLRKKWDDILGALISPGFRQKSKPIKAINRVLLVDCLNSIWANELQMKEKIILDKIKNLFPGIRVEKIRFIS